MAKAVEPITIKMTADQWQVKEDAEFIRQLGFYHRMMRLNSGNALLKGITFSDGTIEFDVNTIGRGAPGLAFRQQDDDNFELLYLRLDPACPACQACMQYAPQVRGVLLWDPLDGERRVVRNCVSRHFPRCRTPKIPRTSKCPLLWRHGRLSLRSGTGLQISAASMDGPSSSRAGWLRG
jgi:hypothetical protein